MMNLSIRLPCGRIEIESSQSVPASSVELARNLPKCKGLSVLDLGCGSGLFAIVAARAGAREVWAVDNDAEAVAMTKQNAERNRAEVRVETGDWFSPVAGRTFDLIVTNPPQTPAPAGAKGPKFAGLDGLGHFERILSEAPRHLKTGGRLYTMLISLADTARFRTLAASFDLQDLGRSRRDFTRAEYESHWPGLFEYLKGRGAEFAEDAGGLYFWIRYFALTLGQA